MNSDIGFLPQYVGEDGTSRMCNNVALSGKSAYNIEMLGPEKSDLPFTPVIVESTDEKYGRVTEDYKNYN